MITVIATAATAIPTNMHVHVENVDVSDTFSVGLNACDSLNARDSYPSNNLISFMSVIPYQYTHHVIVSGKHDYLMRSAALTTAIK